MKRVLLSLIIIVLILGCLGGTGYAVYYFFFMPNNQVVPAFEEGGLNLVIESTVVASDHPPMVSNRQILLPVETVRRFIDPHIFWDHASKKVTITTKDRVIRMQTDNLDALVNNKPMTLNIPATQKDGTVYIPIEFLAEFYHIEVDYLETESVIIIDFKNSLRQTAEPIHSDATVRTGRSIRHPIIKKLDMDSEEHKSLRVFEEYDKWYKVRTSKGEVGYIEKRLVVVRRTYISGISEENKDKPSWKPPIGKINLVWHRTFDSKPDLSKMGSMEGMDVMSPVWFEVSDSTGRLINKADAKYVEWAHDKGYKVWALVRNNFSDSEMSAAVLNSTDARDNLIRDLLAYSALYNIDGINVDFENIDGSNKEVFTQLVREMVPLLKEQGLVVSVDINMKPLYDRKALGEAADYVMVMAYDQHWSSGPNIGSVAQITWVEKIIEMFLKDIPEEKFILGLPTYTRLWGEKPGENRIVEHLSMEGVRQAVTENNASVTWDEESGQFFAEYNKDGTHYQMWLEDYNSMNLRSSLVHKYTLAGAALWSWKFTGPEVWPLLNKNLKEIQSYQEWQQLNENMTYEFSPQAK